MRRECGGCRYFYPMRTLTEMREGKEAVEGECRRLPPMPNACSGGYAEWPVVLKEDWCGEHVEGSYEEMGAE